MPSAELPSRVVAAISFIGRGGGAVKSLEGFRKGHHTVPDVANAVTNGFLAKICETDLATAAEKLFQEVRAGFGYKRRDISLSVTTPSATLVAKDFAVEMVYALEERDPARYSVVTTLRELGDAGLARSETMARVFAGKFSDLSFALQKPARVEAVIDMIEALDETDLRVSYPSDCCECSITVAGLDAHVRFTGPTLDVVFPRSGAPAELIDGFEVVRSAFQISKPLAALLR